jgi:hypothetical protein
MIFKKVIRKRHVKHHFFRATSTEELSMLFNIWLFREKETSITVISGFPKNNLAVVGSPDKPAKILANGNPP